MNDPEQPTRWKHGAAGAPEVFAGLARAQDEIGPDDAALARVIDRLAAQVAAPELAAAFRTARASSAAGHPQAEGHGEALRNAPGAGLGTLAKLIAGALLLGVVGLVAFVLRSEPRGRPLPPRGAPSKASTVLEAAPAASATSGLPPRSADPQPPGTASAEAAPRATRLVEARIEPARKQDTVTELQLVESAQRLLRADPARALTLAEQHQRRFPHGEFAQEREVLAIEALLALGRTSRAVARERAFEKRYPGSSHLPHLRDLVPATP